MVTYICGEKRKTYSNISVLLMVACAVHYSASRTHKYPYMKAKSIIILQLF
jgi:hypothetical protein